MGDRLTALAGALVLAVVVAFVAHDFRPSLSATASQVSQNKGIPWRERQVQAAFGLQVSRDFLTAAQAIVPEDASYRLEVGDNLPGLQPPVWSALPTIVSYAMLPRRQGAHAPWLLCYGCAPARYGAGASIAWQSGGLVIAKGGS